MNSIEFVPAQCPACGGELRVPVNLNMCKCSYCGTVIVLRTNIDFKNILELATTAEEGMNYEEAYKYYTQILEQEPENVRAWIGKGHCAGMLSTFHHPRIEEAKKYILEKGLYSVGDGNIATPEMVKQIKEGFTKEQKKYVRACFYDVITHIGELIPAEYYNDSEVLIRAISLSEEILTFYDWIMVMTEDPWLQKSLKEVIISSIYRILSMVRLRFPDDSERVELEIPFFRMRFKASGIFLNDSELINALDTYHNKMGVD